MLLQMAEFNSFLWPIFHLCLCVCVYTYIYIFNPWVGIDPWLGYLGSSHSLGRSPGEGKGCPLQYSGLENSMDYIVHGSQRVRHDWTQHTRLPCPSPTLGACLNSCPLSRWCHSTISSSSSVVPFSYCLQSFPALRSFQMSQFLTSGGQSTGVWASASVLPIRLFRTDFL